MTINAFRLIFLVFAICFLFGLCGCSLNRAAPVDENKIQAAISAPPANANMKNTDTTLVKLTLSVNSSGSSDTKSHDFRLLIENTSDEPIEIGGLNILLFRFLDGGRIDAKTQLNSPVDIVDIKNLDRNQTSSRITLPIGSKITKEFDIKRLGWLSSNRSVWKYNTLEDMSGEEKLFQLRAELEIFPQQKIKAEDQTLGNQEIGILSQIRVSSNELTIDLVK